MTFGELSFDISTFQLKFFLLFWVCNFSYKFILTNHILIVRFFQILTTSSILSVFFLFLFLLSTLGILTLTFTLGFFFFCFFWFCQCVCWINYPFCFYSFFGDVFINFIHIICTFSFSFSYIFSFFVTALYGNFFFRLHFQRNMYQNLYCI